YNYWGYTIFKWGLGGSNWKSDSLEKFSKAISIKPDYGWPYVNRAVIYLNAEELDRAEGDLEQALKLLPNNPRIHLLWGHYHLEKAERLRNQGLPEFEQQLDDAVKSFEQAREANPSVADVRLYLGVSYE